MDLALETGTHGALQVRSGASSDRDNVIAQEVPPRDGETEQW